jgi:hypothetical protein
MVQVPAFAHALVAPNHVQEPRKWPLRLHYKDAVGLGH